MNIEQFLLWLQGVIGEGDFDLTKIPTPIQAPYWQKVIDDMRPHYYGEMPPSIREAFPNETPHQFEYRLSIHRSATKELLWQAISDIKRMVMSDKFAIEAGVELSGVISQSVFNKKNFEQFLFNSVYPRRVLDPNAILATVAIPSIDLTNRVGIDVRIFASGDILYFSEDLVIVFDRDATSKKPQGTDIYRVFTLNYQIVIVSNKESNGGVSWLVDVENSYPHLSNDLGVTPLGGREITIFDIDYDIDVTYYESDFTPAVPQMDILERKSNQLEAATLRTVFPHMVTQGIKCEAPGCSGGYVEVRNSEGEIVYKNADSPNPEPELKPCSACGGKGTVSLSVLDNITVTPPNNDIYDEDGNLKISGNLADKIIGFASPPIDSIKELREQVDIAKTGTVEALNLVKPSKFAESGVSKEKDREGKSTTLQDVSDSMSMLAKSVLTSYVSLMLIDSGQREDEKTAIKIIQPEDFEIKPVDELAKEYFDNLPNKPQLLRDKQFKQLLKKRFKNNPELVTLHQIAMQYTNGLSLDTLEELQKKESTGIVTLEEAVKANKVNAVLQMLITLGEIDLMQFDFALDMPRLKERIDSIMQPFVDNVNNSGVGAMFQQQPPNALPSQNTDE